MLEDRRSLHLSLVGDWSVSDFGNLLTSISDLYDLRA